MFHILVADDDKHTRRLLQAVLEHEGYRVSVAENGKEALSLLDHQHIDLVVLDVMMPEMDGYDFTRTLRESGNNLPVLMVSRHYAKDLVRDRLEQLYAHPQFLHRIDGRAVGVADGRSNSAIHQIAVQYAEHIVMVTNVIKVSPNFVVVAVGVSPMVVSHRHNMYLFEVFR